MSTWLDNADVCREAIEAACGLPYVHEVEFETFYTYLMVDEPIIQLMPGYLLPVWAEQKASSETLHALAVAAKLENARNRWLDDLVDNRDVHVSLATSQRLNEAIVDLANRRYAQVLPDGMVARFFERLTVLYARHALSLLLDGKQDTLSRRPLELADYESHAEARHGPVRAALEALLLLLEADQEHCTRAIESWHAWGLGAQLYDDALDVEEDFRHGTLTWTVSRTLGLFGDRSPESAEEFYGVALKEGVVTQTLVHAEKHFVRAAELACSTFPRWANVQQACAQQARTLREDYQRLLVLETSDR